MRPKNGIENIGVNGIDKPNGDLKPKTWLDVTYGSRQVKTALTNLD